MLFGLKILIVKNGNQLLYKKEVIGISFQIVQAIFLIPPLNFPKAGNLLTAPIIITFGIGPMLAQEDFIPEAPTMIS